MYNKTIYKIARLLADTSAIMVIVLGMWLLIDRIIFLIIK